MKDTDRLKEGGYEYNPMSGSWLKIDGKSKSMLAIYGLGDGVFLAVKSVGDETVRSKYLTVEDAIEAGEKWLAERGGRA